MTKSQGVCWVQITHWKFTMAYGTQITQITMVFRGWISTKLFSSPLGAQIIVDHCSVSRVSQSQISTVDDCLLYKSSPHCLCIAPFWFWWQCLDPFWWSVPDSRYDVPSKSVIFLLSIFQLAISSHELLPIKTTVLVSLRILGQVCFSYPTTKKKTHTTGAINLK